MNVLTSSLDCFYKTIFYKQSQCPGEMVEVFGRRLHFQKSKPQEDIPTIVVETGIYDCSLSWQLVQSKVSEFAQIITYDRAGYGFSEHSTKPRTFKQMTKELNLGLKKLGIKPPFILVGHSLGGAIVRTYQNRYPEEVVGIVLVDTDHDAPSRMPKIWMLAARVVSYLASFGILHIINKMLGRMAQNHDWTPDMQKTYDSEHRNKPWTLRTCFDESDAMIEGYSQLRPVEGIPVTIISRDPKIPLRPFMSEDAIEKDRKKLEELHERQLEDFQDSHLVIAEGSTHLIQIEKPDVIVSELKNMIQKLRET